MKKIWAINIVQTMYIEILAIVASRVAYILFRQHRFVMNIGYGFDDNDTNMSSVSMVMLGMVLELVFELAIDTLSLGIEEQHGVDLEAYWDMWRPNALRNLGCHMVQPTSSFLNALWMFSSIPTPLFCATSDPCSCVGGGFEIYSKLCQAKQQDPSTNTSSNRSSVSSTGNATELRQAAESGYLSIV